MPGSVTGSEATRIGITAIFAVTGVRNNCDPIVGADRFLVIPPGMIRASSQAMGFKTLEEIQAYQFCRQLKLEVYRLTKDRPHASRDRLFRDQLFNAASSAEVNIAEGFSRFSPGEFVQFLRISRASVAETLTWLQDGADRGYFTEADLEAARGLADSSRRLLTALILSLKKLPGASSPKSPRRPKLEPDPQ